MAPDDVVSPMLSLDKSVCIRPVQIHMDQSHPGSASQSRIAPARNTSRTS
jgi:hypothetical protein